MKIGVVCEGPTDFEFIKHFLPDALRLRGVENIEIVSIQPPRDNSRGGGCTEVINWLVENPPVFRNTAYLGGGLFSLGDYKSSCDGLIIQMDSDVLSDESFKSFLAGKGVSLSSELTITVQEKAAEVKRLLGFFSKESEMTQKEIAQHIYVAAVDATEAWCIAAYKKLDYDPECLVGKDLATCFGKVLNHSEGGEVLDEYISIDKNVDRRIGFCEKHYQSRFLERQASQFTQMVDDTYRLLFV